MFDYVIIQLASLIVVTIGIISECLWINKNPKLWYKAVPVLSIFIHVFVFYCVVFIDRLSSGSIIFTLWSAGLRFHGMFILMAMSLNRLFPSKFKNIDLLLDDMRHKKGASK